MNDMKAESNSIWLQEGLEKKKNTTHHICNLELNQNQKFPQTDKTNSAGGI